MPQGFEQSRNCACMTDKQHNIFTVLLKAGTCWGSWSLLPPLGSRSIRPVSSLSAPPRDRPCWATLALQLSDLDALEGHVNDLLARLIPKGLGKRGRRVAMDLVALPYHGTVDEAHQDEVCRSKAKGGTTHFFTYATAYAVVRGRRYTLAMCRVRAKQTMDHVLRTLLARLVTLGACPGNKLSGLSGHRCCTGEV